MINWELTPSNIEKLYPTDSYVSVCPEDHNGWIQVRPDTTKTDSWKFIFSFERFDFTTLDQFSEDTDKNKKPTTLLLWVKPQCYSLSSMYSRKPSSGPKLI